MTRPSLTGAETSASRARRGRLEGVLSGVVAVFIFATILLSILEGRLIVRSGSALLRADEPVRFWFLLAILSLVAIGLVFVAVTRWRDGAAAGDGLKLSRARRR